MHGLEVDLAEASNAIRKLREGISRGPDNIHAQTTRTSNQEDVMTGGPVVYALPDVVRQAGEDRSYQPSWSGVAGMLNDEHAGIYDATKDLPGWQDPADSQKLYEMAYHSGSIILEIGVYGGRMLPSSNCAALRAMTENGKARPQFYGVDLDINSIPRSLKSLRDAQLS